MNSRLTLIFFVISLLVLIYFFTRGFIPYDEGWFVYEGQRLLQGQVPYKDFEFVYTPGGIYLSALSQLLFGQTILATRIIALLNALLSIALLLWITKKMKLKYWTVILFISLFVFWGPTHINFVWPVMFTLTLGLLACALMFKVMEEKNKTKYLIVLGTVSAFTLIFKQNFGLAILLNSLVFLIINKNLRNLKTYYFFAIGYLIAILLQLAYLGFTKSLSPFLSDLHFILIQKIIGEGLLSSPLPWSYPGSLLYKIFKIVFYGMPLIFSVLGVLLAYKRNKLLLSVATFPLFFYVLSIRPTTDIVHLAPLIAISCLPLLVIYGLIKNNNIRFSIIVAVLFLSVLGAYTALFTNYYKWEPKIVYDRYYLPGKGMIFVDSAAFKSISKISLFVSKNTIPKDYIYVYSFSPMFYFLTDRKSPTKWDYVSPTLLTKQIEKEIISNLVSKKVKVLITDVSLSKDKTTVGKYLRNNFTKVSSVDKYSMWIKSNQ